MLTPSFRLDQDNRTVTFVISAPFSNINELDTSIDGEDFIFQCTPYYLRLRLPGKIVENGKTKVTYDEGRGEFTLVYEKEECKVFEDLECVQNLTTVEIDEIEDAEVEIVETRKVFDEKVDGLEKYGFALRGGYKFQSLTQDFADLFKIDPFEVKFEDRKTIRLKTECEDFNDEHYAADFMDDEEIQEIINQKNPWCNLKQDKINFTKVEKDLIESLPKFDYNLTEREALFARTSLVEILYAFCYDARTTFFEPTCESHWTIRTLSASLCYFDSFSSTKEAVTCGFRRSLIYPLYRSFKLSEAVLNDLKELLGLGKMFIVKCLIEIYNIFLDADSNTYVLNSLFIKDYVRYVMSCDEEFLRMLIEDINQVEIRKCNLNLDLEELEKDLLLEVENSDEACNDVDCLAKDMKKIDISDDDSNSLSSDSTSE